MMSLRLGDNAPNFTAVTSLGELNFYEYLGDSWGVLFSHPADFTPVCTTELGRTAALNEEFAKRNVKPIAISVDDVKSHKEWISDINDTQNVSVQFPIIADEDKKVSELYDMIHPNASETVTVRSVFIIDPAKKVRLTLTYPASTGRNFNEIIRVIDSLQLTDKHKLATPVDWSNGDSCIVTPAVDTEKAKELFGKVEVIRPYLRYVKQPNK
nr:peroxiredoxin [Avrilella dinanensis]